METIQRIEIRPGDKLLCQVQLAGLPKTKAEEYIESVRTKIEQKFPGVDVLVTDVNVKFSVISVA